MISVIIPVYKTEEYLERCVASVRRQTYTDLEIILVDDGSPDGSGVLCDQYALLDERITVLHQRNQGNSGARNSGIDICSGEYVCFVDSDDEIHPRMIELLHNALREGDADLAMCGHRRFHFADELTTSSETDIRNVQLDSSELWEEVFGKLNNSACNKLYKKSIIGELRFPVGLIHGEDLIFNLQYISRCRKAVKVRMPLYYYRERNDSITHSHLSESRFDEIKSKDLARAFIREHRPDQLQNAELYCFRARMNVLRAIYLGDMEEQYCDKVLECKTYVRGNYRNVSGNLSFKEKTEYRLLFSVERLYRLIIRRYFHDGT